jgi:hypothetical protein
MPDGHPAPRLIGLRLTLGVDKQLRIQQRFGVRVGRKPAPKRV